MSRHAFQVEVAPVLEQVQYGETVINTVLVTYVAHHFRDLRFRCVPGEGYVTGIRSGQARNMKEVDNSVVNWVRMEQLRTEHKVSNKKPYIVLYILFVSDLILHRSHLCSS